MVDIAKFFLEFTVDESCGKCTPCRIGTKRLYEILDRITKGEGKIEDLDSWRSFATISKKTPFAVWGRPRPTRCFPPCATSGRSTKRILWKRNVRPAFARP